MPSGVYERKTKNVKNSKSEKSLEAEFEKLYGISVQNNYKQFKTFVEWKRSRNAIWSK